MPTLDDLRAKLPALDGMDDENALDFIKQRYYPNQSLATIQTALNYKAPIVAPRASIMDRVKDTGVGLMRGGVQAAQGVVGLADLASGGAAGKTLADNGVDLSSASDYWNNQLSDTQKATNADVAGAFAPAAGDTTLDPYLRGLGAAVSNPSSIYQAVLNSVPSMLVGGIIGRGAAAIAPKLAPYASGIGEGVITAGQQAEQIRTDPHNPSNVLSGAQTALAAGSGAVTGLIAGIVSRLAVATGFETAHNLAAGIHAGNVADIGYARKLLGGGLSEGTQEFLQSAQEQMAQNVAVGDPVWKDVPQQAVMGALAGLGTGLSVNLAPHGARHSVADPTDPLDPHTPPELKAAAAQAIDDIGKATNVDDAVAAFKRTQLPMPAGPTGLDGDAAMKRLAEAPDVPPPGATIDPETGELVPAPTFKERHDALLAQLEDSRLKQHIRETAGPNALNDILYYAQAANNPNLPGTTSDRMLGVAEALMQRAQVTPVPGTGGAIPPALGAPPTSTVPQIGLDTSPTGRMLVDSGGQATPETRAGATSVADAARAAQPFTADQAGNVATPAPLEPTGNMAATSVSPTPTAPISQPGNVATPPTPTAPPTPQAPPIAGVPQQQGAFADQRAAQDYLSQQRRNSSIRLPRAVPQQFADGSWGVTTDKKAVEAWDAQSLTERAASMARGEKQPAPAPRGTETLPEPMEGKDGMKAVFSHSTAKAGQIHVTLFDADSGNAVATKIVGNVARAKFEAEKMLGIRKPEEKFFEPRANIARAGFELAPAPAPASPSVAPAKPPASERRLKAGSIFDRLAAEGDAQKKRLGDADVQRAAAAPPPEPLKEIKQRDGRKASARARQRMALDPENDTMLQALAKMGGVQREQVRSEFGMKPEELKQSVSVGGLKGFPFRATGGMTLDDARMALQEAGYFRGIAPEDVGTAFEEALFNELGGNPTYTAEGEAKRGAQAEGDRQKQQAEHAQMVEQPAVSADEQRTLDEAVNKAGITEDDITAWTDDDVAELLTTMPKADMLRALGFSDEEVASADAAQGKPAEGGNVATRAAPETGDRGGGEARPALALTQPTPEGLRSTAERADRAAQADEAEQRRLADKATADAQRGDFSLTGSNRPADANPNQGELLSEPLAPYNVGTEAFKRWSNNAPIVRSAEAATHDFKTGEKVVVEAFHGTGRPDRVGETFRKKRATSGPMPYFTSDPEIASSYATGKQDTSLNNEDTSFGQWFKVKMKGDRSTVPLDRAWYRLTPEQRATISDRMGDIRLDDAGNVIYEKDGGDLGNYQWELKQTQRSFEPKGNPLKAAMESWLTSGSIFNDEEKFMTVLKLAGFPMSNVTYDSPHDTFPFVYKTMIAMQKPLVVGDMPASVLAGLQEAAKRDRSRADQYATAWDKSGITLREWVQRLGGQDSQYVWTQIPDKVTAFFESQGYDGIIDTGGKGGGKGHLVYVPFGESQVKSAIGNKGTFDAGKNNILREEQSVYQVNEPTERYDVPTEQMQPTSTEPFYSAFANAVGNVSMKQGDAGAWSQFFKGLESKGVKREEITWSGVEDWIRMQPGKVTKAAVQQYLADNGVRVTETQLGQGSGMSAIARAEADHQAALIVELDNYVRAHDLPHMSADDLISSLQESIEAIEESPHVTSTMQSRIDKLKDHISWLHNFADRWDSMDTDAASDLRAENSPKYSRYTLPGGENYRELLLTLPEKVPMTARELLGGDPQEIPTTDAKAVEAATGIGVADMDMDDVASVLVYPHGGYIEKLTNGSYHIAVYNEDTTTRSLAAAENFLASRFDDGVKGNENTYRSGHWDQPNILAHIRMTDRTDAAGKRVLFIEEIQSDWAQQGKRHGFKAANAAEVQAIKDELDAAKEAMAKANLGGTSNEAVVERYRRAIDDYNLRIHDAVPAAPFVGKTDAWVALALKRAIKVAVDEGFDRVAFVNGQQSADRYSLEKEVRTIEWGRRSDDNIGVTVEWIQRGNPLEFRVKADGTITGNGHTAGELEGRRLEDAVGKAVADKIMAEKSGELHGEGLRIGGEGMKTFYDRILPNVAKDVVKKLGGDGLTKINFGIGNRAENAVHGISDEQPGFDITPKMRTQSANGVPLFEPGQTYDLFSGGAQSDQVATLPAQPVLAVRPDEALPGLYHVTSQLVAVGTKTLPVAKVTTMADAVAALSAIHKFAVEHFDVLITDAKGKPLAVVGSFKGAQSQASIYPSTVLGEALRIKGAAYAYAVHNHPSGNPTLSDADRRLNLTLSAVFDPARVRWGGVAAVGGNTLNWAAVDRLGNDIPGGKVATTGESSITVPIVERTLTGATSGLNAIDGPDRAKSAAAEMSKGEPGIMFMDNQSVPSAWVPFTPDDALNLRENNRFDKLINSAGNAGAASAIIANPNGVFSEKALDNLGHALARGEVRLLDAIDTVSMTSAAQKGQIGGYAATLRIEEQARNYVAKAFAGHEVNETTVARMWDGMRGFDQTAARNLFLDTVTQHGGTTFWQRTVGTQYAKAQSNPTTFGRVFNAVQDYLKDTSVFANAAADRAPDILPKLDTGKDLFKRAPKAADMKAAGAALWQGTLTDSKAYNELELAQMGLNEKAIELYQQARAAINQALDDTAKTEIVKLAGIQGAPYATEAMAQDTAAGAANVMSERTGDADLAKMLAEKVKRVQQLKDEGYAPLMRFGRHTLHITGLDGETQYFGMYESNREANAAARSLKDDPQFAQSKFQRGLMSQEAFRLYQGLNLDALETFAQATGHEHDEVYQDFLKLTKSNRSALKRMIHRQGIAGFSEDMPRVLASFVTSNSRYASGNQHLVAARQFAEAIPKELGDVKDEAVKLLDYVQNPRNEAPAIRGLLFTNFIGGSVASAAVNLTQPFTMSLPYLSQFGGVVKASGHLLAATRAAAGGSAGTEVDAALHRNVDIVSPQEIHHLQAEVSGGGNPMVRKAAFIWGSMFSLSEQFNRRVTFIAAYNAALQQHIEDPDAFARKAVIETQGLYNKGNKPNLARGAIGATVMTFKQFSIHYLEFLGRMWHAGPEGKKAVGVALALLVLTAGAGGLPFADDLDDIIDTLAQSLGYDFNSKRAKRQFVADTLGLGDEAAQFATRGFSGISGIPIDVSLRMGMGNLIPATGILLRSNTDRSKDLLELAGAAGGLGKSALDAGGALLQGDFGKAGLAMAPMAIQNMVKAVQMGETGEYRNAKGQKVVDVDAADVAAKFVGFQPGNVATETQKLGQTMQSIQLAKNVTQEIAQKWAQALNDHDAEAAAAARAELRDWNEKNPDEQLKISMQSLLARVREMRLDRDTRTIKRTPIGMRQEVREALQ